jgi:hypothetical protein
MVLQIIKHLNENRNNIPHSSGNRSLSRELLRSGRDAGENLIAETSACP